MKKVGLLQRGWRRKSGKQQIQIKQERGGCDSYPASSNTHHYKVYSSKRLFIVHLSS